MSGPLDRLRVTVFPEYTALFVIVTRTPSARTATFPWLLATLGLKAEPFKASLKTNVIVVPSLSTRPETRVGGVLSMFERFVTVSLTRSSELFPVRSLIADPETGSV